MAAKAKPNLARINDFFFKIGAWKTEENLVCQVGKLENFYAAIKFKISSPRKNIFALGRGFLCLAGDFSLALALRRRVCHWLGLIGVRFPF